MWKGWDSNPGPGSVPALGPPPVQGSCLRGALGPHPSLGLFPEKLPPITPSGETQTHSAPPPSPKYFSDVKELLRLEISLRQLPLCHGPCYPSHTCRFSPTPSEVRAGGLRLTEEETEDTEGEETHPRSHLQGEEEQQTPKLGEQEEGRASPLLALPIISVTFTWSLPTSCTCTCSGLPTGPCSLPPLV